MNAPMYTRRPLSRSPHPWLIGALALSTLLGCDPGQESPPLGIQISVQTPTSTDANPLADSNAGFLVVQAVGPDLDGVVAPSVTPLVGGQAQTALNIPFGFQRQLSVEIWSGTPDQGPIAPFARGVSDPVDITGKGATQAINTYVTYMNRFAPVEPLGGAAQAISDGRIGATAADLKNSTQTMILGGAQPAASGTDAFDIDSYSAVLDSVLLYDASLRQVIDLSSLANVRLINARSFHASAVGVSGKIGVSGGYINNDGDLEITNSVEYFDPVVQFFRKAEGVDVPDLTYARARHTMTRMFDDEDYFIIAGGEGSAEAMNSWEIWHPQLGTVAVGQLQQPRFNHKAIRLPDAQLNGGFLVVVGGEDDNGVIDNFEVLRYDRSGNVASKGNPVITCRVNGEYYTGEVTDAGGNKLPSTQACPLLQGQTDPSQYQEFSWTPNQFALADSVGRTLPGVAFVSTASYNFLYVVGGFGDKAKTQPLDRVDVFDLNRGTWVQANFRFDAQGNGAWEGGTPSVLKLSSARGAPMVSAVTTGPFAGSLLVAGGADGAGQPISSAETVYFSVKPSEFFTFVGQATGKTQPLVVNGVENGMLGGGRVYGLMHPLSSGHILVGAGAGKNAGEAKLVGRTEVMLWNPLL
jgi:hypothetical protein